VLAYLSRYTHRVAIANSRLIRFDHNGVTFKWKDYRIEGRDRYKAMTLATHEFIRRFLIHVLPDGFHRIRHYGLFATASRAETSRGRAGCSLHRRRKLNPTMHKPPRPTNPRRPRIRVLVAAVA
jgi:Putative transposase